MSQVFSNREETLEGKVISDLDKINQEIEDKKWNDRAINAEKEGFLSDEETNDIVKQVES